MRNGFKSSSEMLKEEISQWIINKIDKLEDRAKFSSINAVRFLHWSNDTSDMSPILASFSAMHATEEAVAAFIAAAKVHGHNKYAKKVNLHNHKIKALVSIFAQRMSLILAQGEVSIAIHPKQEALAYRVPTVGGYHYDALHLSSFSIGDEDDEANSILLGDTPLLEDVANEARRVARLRNDLIYATENGCPTGFINLEYEIARNTALSIGLIWAAVDMYMHPDHNRRIVDQVLSGMAGVIANNGGKSCKTEGSA
ncbi:hypothetical protein [Halomonas hibernica]|uniref:hypothetical protein n=1 Tax=Halomonas hibernica TaxID=2591147 RepID=UPI001553E7BB|nr:hypothetical protein [Halomonas hibernica]